MSSQEQPQSGDAQQERFDDPGLGSGVRDTGTDAPEHGSADRPAGTVDEDANPPLSDASKSDVYGGTGEIPPQDTGAAVPPYEGRTPSAPKEPSSTTESGGANVGGATGPVATSSAVRRRVPNVLLRDDPNGRRRLRVCLGSRRVFIGRLTGLRARHHLVDMGLGAVPIRDSRRFRELSLSLRGARTTSMCAAERHWMYSATRVPSSLR